MPIGEADARHLLRRTEFVDRQSRVDALATQSIGAAVDNVMAVGAPGTLGLGSNPETWHQGEAMTLAWLDQMAGGTSRPFRERMAFFWHGHICTELGKTRSAPAMREQIQLFRTDGVNGSVGQLMKDMAVQTAMLRYLDNDLNVASSPNQNFARELMELFVLGVGNYTEADVEAATAAWTGHTAHWETGQYSFLVHAHERATQTFLGQQINNEATDPFEDVGFDTIDVMLGSGTVPGGGSSREVAAAFLSKKLWQEFGEATSGGVPPGVLAAMTTALLDNDFEIRPWVRAMLTHPDFYADTTKNGLVRQPVEYVVALMVATGLTAAQAGQTWLLQQAGQVPLYPPNVSGWKPNGYWVNASALEARNRIAEGCFWRIHETYWVHDWSQRHQNYLEFPGGLRIYQHEIVGGQGLPAPHDIAPLSDADLVDRFLDHMDLHVSPATRQSFLDFCAAHAGSPGGRHDLLLLILLAPEMHIA